MLRHAVLLLLLLLLPLLLVLLVACNGGKVINEFTGSAMGTSYTIKYVAQDLPQEQVQVGVQKALDEWDRLFSTYNQNSEISKFNAHKSTEVFAVSPNFGVMMFEALKLAEVTKGAFDPTIAPLLRLYGFGPGATRPAQPPADVEIQATMAKVGYRKLVRLPGRGLKKEVVDLKLDLNAIAKGAGVDRIANLLQETFKIKSYMVEIGGEVSCRGSKPDGSSWTLGIESPYSDASGKRTVLQTVQLNDEAMATSGSYRQFREFGKERVHHILDPRTGKNAETDVVSVTVIAGSCDLADGLATALMVVGPDGCEEIIKRYPGMGVRVLFLLRGKDGKVRKKGFRWRK